MHILVEKTECAGIRYAKTNENLTAHLFVPGQWILLRETTVTETEKTWRIEIEQRSWYVPHKQNIQSIFYDFDFSFTSTANNGGQCI